MTQFESDIDFLIDKYLSGELSHELLVKLKSYVEESDENRAYVRRKIEIWFSSGVVGEKDDFDSMKAYNRFLLRIGGVKRKKHLFDGYKLNVLYRVAVILLILAIPYVYWSGKNAVRKNFGNIVVEAPIGGWTRMYLPDSTMVCLNSGTKIIYSQNFGISDRRVCLVGEGCFEVTHNERLPFLIDSREMTLRVVGTKFNFKNYIDDDEAVVGMREGKVAIYNKIMPMSEFCLVLGEKMVLNKKNGKIEISSSKKETVSSWINNELTFDEDLLVDVARYLSRSYGCEIDVVDSLKQIRFYGTFNKHKCSIDDILNSMIKTHRFNYKKINGKYLLY